MELEKKAFQRIMKESPAWHSLKVVFGWTVLQIGHKNQSIHVIFKAPCVAELGLTAGVKQNFGESHVSKKLVLAQAILLSAIFC